MPQTNFSHSQLSSGYLLEDPAGSDATWGELSTAPEADSRTTGTPDTFLDQSGTVDEFDSYRRAFITFDTSSLPDQNKVKSAEVVFTSLTTAASGSGVGVSLTSVTPADLSNVTIGDFDQLNAGQASSFWSIDQNESTATVTLNAEGISNISTRGISVFGLLFDYDVNGNEPSGSADDRFQGSAELQVMHEPALQRGSRRMMGLVVGTSDGSVFLLDDAPNSTTTLDLTSTVTSRWRSGLLPSDRDIETWDMLQEAYIEYEARSDGSLGIYATDDLGNTFTSLGTASILSTSGFTGFRTAFVPLRPFSGRHLQIELRSTDGSRPKVGRLSLKSRRYTGRYDG